MENYTKEDLVDALKWALDQIEDDLDPDYQTALAEAKRIAEEAERSIRKAETNKRKEQK